MKMVNFLTSPVKALGQPAMECRKREQEEEQDEDHDQVTARQEAGLYKYVRHFISC